MSIASIPLDILVQILNYSDNIKTIERVCKRWRLASRQRTSLRIIGNMTVEHIKRYPRLSFVDVTSKKGQYDWPLFFQLVTAWKMVGKSKDFHLIFRLPTHEFDWEDETNSPFNIQLKDAADYNMIWLEYDNGRLVMSVVEFIPIDVLLNCYCTLETKRNVVIYQTMFNVHKYSTKHLQLDSIEYHMIATFPEEVNVIGSWSKNAKIYVDDGWERLMSQVTHVEIIHP